MKTWKTKNGFNIIRLVSGRSNVFLLTNGENNILIDTSPKRLWPKLNRRLNKSGIKRIDLLILTHSHYDHSGNAAKIREKFGARVIVHRNEALSLKTGCSGVPGGTFFFTRILVNCLGKPLAGIVRSEPCECDITVDSEYNLNDFGFNAYIIHTPGHSAGSMSIIVDDEIALVGDTMFGVFKGTAFPPFADDTLLLMQSWEKLLQTGCSVFIPSHGSENSRHLVQNDYNKRKISLS